MSSNAVYQFDGYRVDPAKRELWYEGRLVPLQPKAFDCLVYLLEHRDRVVGHDEIIATVWGKVEIGDSVLGQIISRIRGVLGDNANRQITIRTITRVGYSWVMPVRVLAADPAEADAPPEPAGQPGAAADTGFLAQAPAGALPAAAAPASKRRKALPWRLGLAAVALAALIGLWGVMPTFMAPAVDAKADTAIVLPVRAPQAPGNAWIRLGVMDLIGERLRAAGQTVVPSDNVVALARRLPAEPTAADIEALADATAASLVLRASAEPNGDGWRVELRTAHGREHALAAHGDGADVIEAARAATDRMAILLDLAVAAPDPGTAHGDALDYLLQQVKAATLVDRLDEARHLLEKSGPHNEPRILYQRGDIELRAGNYALAQQILLDLLDRVPAERDPILRAQVLHGLAYTHIRQVQNPQALPYVEEAIALLETREPFRNAHDTLGFAISARAFLRRVIDSDYAGAEADYGRARVLFESSGDQLALARLDANLSMLLGDAHRIAEAQSLGRAALERLALFGDVQSELRLRITLAELHSDQLETAAALEDARQFERPGAQVDNPALIELARLNEAYMLADAGRLAEARERLRHLLEPASPPGPDDVRKGLWPQYVAAWLAQETGDAAGAVAAAGEALARHAGKPTGAPWNIARTWATLSRAQRARAEADAAAATLAAARHWAEPYQEAPLVVHWITLMRAEDAAARGDADAARQLYEAAWSQAVRRAVPREMLNVAQSYCDFLFATGQVQDATRIAGHMARWGQSNYDAALLQVRLHHALGQTSAWRRTLDRARQLAGERDLPPALLVPPTPP
ncbi:winged helix-turn-helix domain-containing protein [Dokdonella koreensis]|uniref:Transcriptional regulatory protein n=1 Tax=Dokdonella koreensis DS-123 TaxID=1300342 RepID=A0A160DVP6_9GAMM|nr:winged helix-turn-helix domain-containing protein [Dokdonella koreensis]ANB18645.1 Putative transcriptional regulatory protein [Dokdonella koreensis DS-123]